MRSARFRVRFFLAAALAMVTATAEAAVGLTEIAGKADDGIVTVYYPSGSEAQTVKRGRFIFQLALEGAPLRGNGRLIVISHGSGGSRRPATRRARSPKGELPISRISRRARSVSGRRRTRR